MLYERRLFRNFIDVEKLFQNFLLGLKFVLRVVFMLLFIPLHNLEEDFWSLYAK